MLLCYYAVNDLTVICMAFLSWQWWRTERTINKYWTELHVRVQVREVAAQLSQPLTSGQRSPCPKATLGSSSSFTLPQRGKAEAEAEAEGGGGSGKTDHGQKTLSWMSASIWAFVILNSGSLRVSHWLSHIDVLLLFFSFLHHVCYTSESFSIPADQTDCGASRRSGPREVQTNVAQFSGRGLPGSQENREESDSLLQHIQVWTHRCGANPPCFAVKTVMLMRIPMQWEDDGIQDSLLPQSLCWCLNSALFPCQTSGHKYIKK